MTDFIEVFPATELGASERHVLLNTAYITVIRQFRTNEEQLGECVIHFDDESTLNVWDTYPELKSMVMGKPGAG